MPIKSTGPASRARRGRRERESRREGRREQSLRDSFACVAVKGIPVCRSAGPFAGVRPKVGLGRSGGRGGSPPAAVVAPATADARRAPRRGTSSACATKRMHPSGVIFVTSASGTRPSLGPSTRARQSSLCSAAQASEVGRSREYRGRANLHLQEEPAPGLSRSGRCAARRASPLPQGRGRGASEKEGGRGLRPCEDRWSPGSCPHVVNAVCRSR